MDPPAPAGLARARPRRPRRACRPCRGESTWRHPWETAQRQPLIGRAGAPLEFFFFGSSRFGPIGIVPSGWTYSSEPVRRDAPGSCPSGSVRCRSCTIRAAVRRSLRNGAGRYSEIGAGGHRKLERSARGRNGARLVRVSVTVNEGASFAPLAAQGRGDWITADRVPRTAVRCCGPATYRQHGSVRGSAPRRACVFFWRGALTPLSRACRNESLFFVLSPREPGGEGRVARGQRTQSRFIGPDLLSSRQSTINQE